MGILIADDFEKDTITLINWCREVANNPKRYQKLDVAKASELWKEWSSFQTQSQPQSPKEKQNGEARLLSLKKRMAAFRKTTA